MVTRRWSATGAKAKSSLLKFIKCIFFLKDSFCTQKSFNCLVWYFAGGHLLRFYVLVCVPFCNFWFCPIPFIRFFPATIFSFSFALTQPHLLSGSSWKQMRQGQYWSTDYECAKSDLMDHASYIWSGVNSMIASGSVSSWHGQPCGLQLFKGEQF